MHEIIDDPKTDKVYLIMDFLSGGNLMDKVDNSDDGLDLDRGRQYFRSIVSALHYCHEVQHIAHRDVKPENILLDKNGIVKLCDFGVSEYFKSSSDLLNGAATKGTYLFMSPEMVDPSRKQKRIHAKASDIWACGVTLFNLLTR